MYILTYKSTLTENPIDTHLIALINPPDSGVGFGIHRIQGFSVGNAEFRVKITEDYKVKGRTNGTGWINSVSGEPQSKALVVADLKSSGLDDFLKIKTCFLNGSTEEVVSPDENFILFPGTAIVVKVATDNRNTMVGCNLAWQEAEIAPDADGVEDGTDDKEEEVEEYLENANG